MTPTGSVPPPEDQDQRRAAVHERERNVVIEAGAGTGKTSTLVQRLLELVAPAHAGPAMRLNRVAAITFTRKAAGELGLRIRESLLAALADEPLTTQRRQRLRQALGDLDTAWVGTIHSFADRLLRLNPAEAGLNPNYEIARDEEELIEETYEQLLRGAETGTLDRLLAGSDVEAQAEEAAATVVAALGAGVLAQSQETGFAPRTGLDALVREFIRQRDVPPVMPPPTAADLEAVRRAMEEFRDLARTVTAASDFGDWVRSLAETMAELMTEEDPAVLFAEMAFPVRERCQGKLRKGEECGSDAATWRVCKALTVGGKDRGHADLPPLRAALTGPLDEWLGRRLVRLSPVVLALYQATKRRRGVVDPIDLLLLLRNVLRDNLEARTRARALFDHLLVDEFQDTDPLQAEIVQFLCEAGPPAANAAAVRLAPGRLTVVGDPKQSIYRFRRADVEAYARFVDALAPTALEVHLRANFRSVPALTEEVDDLGLQRVGVLELVHEQVAEPALQEAARLAIVGEEVAQAAQQVGEVQTAEGELGLAGPAREPVGGGDGECREVLRVGILERGDAGGDGLVPAPELVFAALRVVPVVFAPAEALGGGLQLDAEERGHELVGVGRRRVPQRLADIDEVRGAPAAAV